MIGNVIVVDVLVLDDELDGGSRGKVVGGNVGGIVNGGNGGMVCGGRGGGTVGLGLVDGGGDWWGAVEGLVRLVVGDVRELPEVGGTPVSPGDVVGLVGLTGAPPTPGTITVPSEDTLNGPPLIGPSRD